MQYTTSASASKHWRGSAFCDVSQPAGVRRLRNGRLGPGPCACLVRARVLRSYVVQASHEIRRRFPLRHRSNRIDRSNRHSTGRGPPIEGTAVRPVSAPAPAATSDRLAVAGGVMGCLLAERRWGLPCGTARADELGGPAKRPDASERSRSGRWVGERWRWVGCRGGGLIPRAWRRVSARGTGVGRAGCRRSRRGAFRRNSSHS